MNINPLKSIWNTGRTAGGTYIMYSREITTVQLAATAGLDFVVFDLEHRPHNIETIHDLCQVARILGMAPLVGPSDIASAEISRLLDVGASGVIIPHFKTALEVELAVKAVRYPPEGERGRCGQAGHNLYKTERSTSEELTHYNDGVSLFLKIESKSAIENLEELLAPEGVDGVMVGPMDLSLDMRIPGEVHDESLTRLMDQVSRICQKRNIHYGVFVPSTTELKVAVEMGASWVIVGSEMEFLSRSWKAVSQIQRS